MKIDLDAMSLKELKELNAQTAKAIANFENRKKQQAISALEEQAKAAQAQPQPYDPLANL